MAVRDRALRAAILILILRVGSNLERSLAASVVLQAVRRGELPATYLATVSTVAHDLAASSALQAR